MKGFTSEINSQLGGLGTKGGSKFSGGFLDVLKGSAIGTTLGNLATKAGSSIMDGLSVGIGRLDTIENFPRVMEALGYSTDEADKSINTIMEHLDGLPTATQDMVTLTQAISDSTGDLDLATRAALGFNDMMLANGASAAEVATAQGVLNRVLGKGSATAAQWQSLTSVMPAQLGIVAKQMLGAGASTEDLHSALEDGTVSWNDFLQAIADLDKSGYVDEAGRQIASFEEQARANSDGIGTAIDNIKNRIGAGWADILKAIGRSDISSTINTMSYGVRDGMRKVADAIKYVKDAIGKTNIGENLGKIGSAIGDFLGKIGQGAAPVLKDFADKMVDFIDKALQWVVDHGDLVTSLLASIGTALAFKGALGAVSTITGVTGGLKALGQALPLVSGIKDLPAAFTLASEAGGPLSGVFKGLGGIIEWCAANPMVLIVGAIAAVVGGLVWFFTQTEEGQKIWQSFCDSFMQLVADIQEDWAEFCEVCSREWESFKAFIDGIPEWWQGVVDYWKNALDEQAENFRLAWEKIKEDFSQAWENINTFLNEKTQAISDAIVTFGDNIQAALESAWNYITAAASNAWNAITTTVSTAATNIYTWVVERLSALRDEAAAIWDSFKATAHSTWESIKTTAATMADNMRATVVDKVTAAKDSALAIFDNIKNGIRDKIQWAKDQVSHIIDGIKSLFNFSWSLPAPKLPHINWHWEDIGGILSVPSFDGISWYAKGGVFNRATIIGIGEKDREAALPLNNKTYGEIARGIVNELGCAESGVIVTGNTFIVREEADIDRIAEAVSRMVARERGSAT